MAIVKFVSRARQIQASRVSNAGNKARGEERRKFEIGNDSARIRNKIGVDDFHIEVGSPSYLGCNTLDLIGWFLRPSRARWARTIRKGTMTREVAW